MGYEGQTLAAAEQKLTLAKKLIAEAHQIASSKAERANRKLSEARQA